jgi:2,4-dienoyl-CoA reductase-like NADH-dependent reductase (Old Yellow Enzyme family)
VLALSTCGRQDAARIEEEKQQVNDTEEIKELRRRVALQHQHQHLLVLQLL